MSPSTLLPAATPLPDEARLRRWRLVLGSEAEGSCGKLSGVPAEMDQALAALYDADAKGGLKDRRGGRGGSAPSVARWLGDIRKYFPGTAVQGPAVRAGRRTLHPHPAAGAAHVFSVQRERAQRSGPAGAAGSAARASRGQRARLG